MHTRENAHQTYELTYVIGYENTNLHFGSSQLEGWYVRTYCSIQLAAQIQYLTTLFRTGEKGVKAHFS